MFCIYAVSDSIGETAELVGKGVACQFEEKISVIRVPYIDSRKKASQLISEIIPSSSIIISTIIKTSIREYMTEICLEKNIPFLSILSPGINIVSELIGSSPSLKPGNIWNKMDEDYFKKISAIEFAIQYDDSKDYGGLDSADVILIGLSRTSKTPLSMYLAYKGLKVINIPLIPEVPPPEKIFTVDRSKIIALTIDPIKLIEIRKHRLEKYGHTIRNSGYFKDERVLEEFDYADRIIKRLGCKRIDVTDRAIEDTALMINNYLKSLKKQP